MVYQHLMQCKFATYLNIFHFRKNRDFWNINFINFSRWQKCTLLTRINMSTCLLSYQIFSHWHAVIRVTYLLIVNSFQKFGQKDWTKTLFWKEILQVSFPIHFHLLMYHLKKLKIQISCRVNCFLHLKKIPLDTIIQNNMFIWFFLKFHLTCLFSRHVYSGGESTQFYFCFKARLIGAFQRNM